MCRVIDRILRYSAAGIMVLSLVTAADGMIGERSATPIASIDDPITEVPSTPIIQAGVLKEEVRTFDLLCAGNCNFNENSAMNLIVRSAEKVPSFVTIQNDGTEAGKGKVVFAVPQPMSTVTLPAGHESYVTISLEKLKSKFDSADTEAVKYLALGIREKGSDTFLDMLYMPHADSAKNNSEICIHMTSANIVELVPLIMKTDMSVNTATPFEPVEPGSEVTVLANLLNGDDRFDFTTVFRVNFDKSDTDPIGKKPWTKVMSTDIDAYFFSCADDVFLLCEDDGTAVGDTYICSCTNSIFSNLGDPICDRKSLIVNFKGKRIIYSNIESEDVEPYYGNRYRVQINESNWSDWKSTSGICSMYTRWYDVSSITCVALEEKLVSINGYDGTLTQSYDGVVWNELPNPPLKNFQNAGDLILSLCYGNGKLIAVTREGFISISEDKGDTWRRFGPLSALQSLDPYNLSLCLSFGCGKFLGVNADGILLSSTDGVIWNRVGDIGSGDCWGLCHNNGAFYAIDQYGHIYRSIKQADLTIKDNI